MAQEVPSRELFLKIGLTSHQCDEILQNNVLTVALEELIKEVIILSSKIAVWSGIWMRCSSRSIIAENSEEDDPEFFRLTSTYTFYKSN